MYIAIDSLAQRGADTWRMSYHPVFEDGSCGERDWFTIKGAANKREAKKKANERRRELEDLISDRPVRVRCGKTLLEWQGELVRALVDTGNIQETTGKGYLRDIQACKLLSDIDMAEINENLVQLEIKRMRDAGYSQNTIVRRLRLARQAIDKALAAGLVTSNPIRNVKLPKMTPTRASALSDDERDRMLELAKHMEGLLPLIILFGLSLGVRGEEACGFKWSDREIIQDRWFITVNRAAVSDGGRTVVKQPKTAYSIRTLPEADFLTKALERHRRWYLDRCEEHGVQFSEDFYILGDIDGRPMNPDTMRRLFKSFCVSFDFDCTYHELRHTFTTTMIAEGVDVRTVAYWLGHSDPGFTLRVYCDADKSAVLKSVGVVNSLFN